MMGGVSAKRPIDGGSPRRPGNAFLLAQIGAHAAACFSQRVAELDVTPAQAGLLRLVGREPGQSQQAIAAKLGIPPSRLVLLVDSLEDRDWIERRRNPHDRRHYALYLTDLGTRFLGQQLGPVATAHNDEICAGLDEAERVQLQEFLERIAAHQGLVPGVHPGYRHSSEPT